MILEAVDSEKRLKWPRRLSVDDRKEFERLVRDGHEFQQTRRYYEAAFDPVGTRNTQLYRTLPHEIGHYVHYLTVVERPGHDDENFEGWKKRDEKYWSISTDEKERFAHRYAADLCRKLAERGVIPFEPLVEE